MKSKALLILSIILLFSISGKSTHLMGGEIIAQQINGYQYQIFMTVYRDTAGVPMENTAQFYITDSAGTNVATLTTPYDSVLSGNTLPMYPYGVEVYFFIDTITFSGSGTYTIGWSSCCRNGAIQNISTPLSQSMFLQTEITVFDSTSNSTPWFLVPASIFLPSNTPWQYNPLPFDPDGDSLYWSLSQPLNALNTPCPGYTLPPGSISNPMTINPITGTITWTATMVGNFVTSVLVEEFRDGQKIGEIRRDMQFIVVQTSVTGPLWNTGNLPVDSFGNVHVNLIQNSSFSMSVSGYSPNGSTLYADAFGEPFFTAPNPAQWTCIGSSSNDTIQGTILWAPSSAQSRSTPYILALRLTDGFLAQDLSIIFQVSTGIGLEENKLQYVSFPNPASEGITITPSPDRAFLYNTNGQQWELLQINNRWDISHLTPGSYVLRAFSRNGETVGTTRLIIQ
tara:strand:- start:696 stop:2054 length:1359 start_codon:yes stop_codon:yes gene_type:complete